MKTEPRHLLADILSEIEFPHAEITPDTAWTDLFEAGLTPLDFELAIYSLEASVKRSIKDSFYEGGIEKVFGLSVGDFVDQFLEDEISSDPLFVFRMFLKFKQSAGWQADEDHEPYSN